MLGSKAIGSSEIAHRRCVPAQLLPGYWLPRQTLLPSKASQLTLCLLFLPPSLLVQRFTYKYDEFKLIIEGTICIKEPSSGTQIEAKVGDVVNISKGADLVL